jgi:hypothetical protein
MYFSRINGRLAPAGCAIVSYKSFNEDRRVAVKLIKGKTEASVLHLLAFSL